MITNDVKLQGKKFSFLICLYKQDTIKIFILLIKRK